VITDRRTAAQNLALASFSALAQARSPHIDAILEALGQALQTADLESSRYFYEFLETGLGDTPAGRRWKEINMTVHTYFPGRGTLIELAHIESKTEDILRVLEVRGLPVSDEVRAHIASCTNIDRLLTWLERAVTVTRAEDLFIDSPNTPDHS